MVKVLDVSKSGGQLVISGSVLTLPNVASTEIPLPGSLRFNKDTGNVELYVNAAWNVVYSGTNLSSEAVIKALGFTPAEVDATGKILASQLPARAGAILYQGTWDADSNTPPLVAGVGTRGDYYKVAVAGNTAIDGISAWLVGDMIIFDGVKWDKIEDAVNTVFSVAGKVGPVELVVTDVSGAAPIESPQFTGNPTTPSPTLDDASQSAVNTKWVKDQEYLHDVTLSGAINGSGKAKITTSFAWMPSGTVLANTKKFLAKPIYTTVSDLLDAAIGDSQDAVLYRGEQGWMALNSEDLVNKFSHKITSEEVIQALGYVPVAMVNSVAPEQGNVVLNVVSKFNDRVGEVKLSEDDVIDALGYVPMDQDAFTTSVGFGGSALFAPFTNNQILARIAMGFAVRFSKALPDSTAVCLTPSTENVSLTLYKNTTAIGSVNFQSGATTGTFVFNNDVILLVGDILELDGPNPADITFGNLTYTFVGRR